MKWEEPEAPPAVHSSTATVPPVFADPGRSLEADPDRGNALGYADRCNAIDKRLDDIKAMIAANQPGRYPQMPERVVRAGLFRPFC